MHFSSSHTAFWLIRSILRAFLGQKATHMPQPLHQARSMLCDFIIAPWEYWARTRKKAAGPIFSMSYMLSQMALPKAEQATSVAPSIWRARS